MVLPKLILTRPRADAEAFAAALDPAAIGAVELVIAPLLEIGATNEPCSISPDEAAIFTSANGVRFAPKGQGRTAYCVGERTTRCAMDHGWKAKQVGVTAKDLIQNLCNQPPEQNLVHLAGVHTRGEVAQSLTAAGIRTRYVAIYDQIALDLPQDALVALSSPCILPVFSPRTAKILVGQAKGRFENAHIVALSEAVAAPFSGENPLEMLIMSTPQAVYIRKEVENLCKALSRP
ncbi:uroporphyrinogen-III synthase [Sulfitobacter donghicola]|uniref:Uroporphyrinogen-III synthase n=1 Tax=Sulfitobacter donghicola DSW-25 = KCTC 12864 = JCM 14565 TaxID=1300350 RepID=A0A073IYZ9_9RHOB|nr:uroporphyrinogen-III synthase [Sulfitobacter donghicola]KEJ90612.1 uroporphyrinogen-III synthase [Sulfitobacter donghicola DSW-25 = KCTC 12864 = JCM 14565]KIN67861.1 Uroporphyrinogen-III synthase [Sulfitobacter donghicola DSW-25 = KCTC 12864 = JCM 14565]